MHSGVASGAPEAHGLRLSGSITQRSVTSITQPKSVPICHSCRMVKLGMYSTPRHSDGGLRLEPVLVQYSQACAPSVLILALIWGALAYHCAFVAALDLPFGHGSFEKPFGVGGEVLDCPCRARPSIPPSPGYSISPGSVALTWSSCRSCLARMVS